MESKNNDARSELDVALAEIEQRCQEIRWRLANFPADQIVLDLETEIGDLLGEAGRVAAKYGEMRALAKYAEQPVKESRPSSPRAS